MHMYALYGLVVFRPASPTVSFRPTVRCGAIRYGTVCYVSVCVTVTAVTVFMCTICGGPQ